MNDKPELTESEDEEHSISTAERLLVYLSENRQFATALVRAFSHEFVTDGSHPINDILEKGYEDSFYMDDLMGFNEEFEAIVSTPMIEIATDWDQPFDDHDFGTSIYTLLENIGVDEELASDVRLNLMQECLRLVGRKGQTKPNSRFVDIFGLKVLEVYKPLHAVLQEKLEHQRQNEDEDDWNNGIDAEMLRDALGSAIEKAVPLIAEWMAETIQAEGESLVFNVLKRMSS